MAAQTNEDLDSSIEGTVFTWRMALTQGSTGVIAIPTVQQDACIVRQAHSLQSVFNLLGGFTVTSWLRTSEHNKAVGGAPKSAHLLGLATDFVPTHCSPDEARARIKAAGVYPGRTEIDATTWCHYDLTGTKDFYARAPGK